MPMRQPNEIPSSSNPSKKLATPRGLTSTASTPLYQPLCDTLCLSEEQLLELSFSFSKHIPMSKFTPAEIQGYLLLYRQNPWDAVANVEAWANETINAKTQGKDEEARDSGVDGSEEEGEMGEGNEAESPREEVGEVKEIGKRRSQ